MTEKYNPKINLYFIALFFVFISFGLLHIYLNRNELDLDFVGRYLPPSVFIIYGFISLIMFFRTKYMMQDHTLIINAGFKNYEIAYKNIINITRRKINPLFKYGRISGLIRGETDTDVLVITFLDDQKERRIMISPKEMELFIENIYKKCPNLV